MTTLKRGDICRTNLSQPGGLVMVLDVSAHGIGSRNVNGIEIDDYTRVVHIEDHPYGYERGTIGGYNARDLILVDAEIVEKKDRQP